MESRDARLPDYKLPEKGSPYEGREATRYEGWVFATAVPSDKVGWTDHYYLNERLNQEAYNFSIEYPWVDRDYPRVTRTYVFLRSDAPSREPEPHIKDSVFCECVMVDWRITRLDDPVQDSLFVGVTKIFERVPAPTKVVLDRPESVLPFNQRVAVPGIIKTTVEENATTGSSPAIIREQDWHVEETSNTAFRKTVERTKRVLPPGGSNLRGQTLTRQQQIGTVTSNWQIGQQTIIARARLIESNVLNVGNNTTIKEETIVPRVFPAGKFEVSIPDTIPPEFRDLLPVRVTGITEEGQAAPPDLGLGELERISEQQTELIKRDSVTSRDIDQLPKTLIDKQIDGIQTHGSEFGGVFETARTLDRAPQAVEEGFGIIRSAVKNLGSGLTTRETERLATLQGAHLLLTNPGRNFVCDPAVVFDATGAGGGVGHGAVATAILSEIPGSGGGIPGEDSGGTFPLTLDSLGDANGALYFLGARYNNGIWTNPFIAGTIGITYVSPGDPLGDAAVATWVDREEGFGNITIQPTNRDGTDNITFDLGLGKTLAANAITIKTIVGDGSAHRARIQASNDKVTWTTIASDVTLPATSHTWVPVSISDPTAYRYFRLFGIDPENPAYIPPAFPRFGFDEIEFYGTLNIVPGVNLNYIFDGDAKGAFYYLGKRGNGGVWRNPQTNGDIVVSADGLVGGTLDELVDRLPSNVYATSGAPAYYFDLKAGRALLCNKLSFRQRRDFASGNTSFNLQGRNDLGDPNAWVDLATIQPVPQTPNAWLSVDITSTTFYRQFRIITAQSWFTIGEIELYGALRLPPPVAPPSTFSLTSIVVNNGGSGYLTPPEVRIIPNDGGSGATARATVVNGVVTAVTILTPGYGYGIPPSVHFFVTGGGSGATADAVILAGAIDSITVTDPGSEYTDSPVVLIVGDGTGATANALLSPAGEVSSIMVTAPGSGYTIASVLIKAAGGPSAVAAVGYGVASVAVTNGGANYVSPPAANIVGDGLGVVLQAILGFPIASVAMTTLGSGYTSTPAAVFSGTGTGAAGTAVRGFPVASVSFSFNSTLYLTAPAVVVSGGGIYGAGAQFEAFVGRPLLAITVGVQGSGYTSDPAVAIAGDGSGATAHSVRSFAIDSITVDAGGSAYTSPPVVTIAPPTGANGVQATAHAVLTTGAVTSIVIDNPGFGYLTAPAVTFSGGGGTGAAATAVLASAGAIDSIVIDTVGNYFSVPPPVTLTGGGGSGAVISATIDTGVTGILVRISIVNAGSGYTSAPVLSVVGQSNGSGTLSTSGQIVAVTLTAVGSGYTIPATVGFVGGGGTGAAGLATLGVLGKVKSVSVINNGEGFSPSPLPTVNFTGGGGTGATATAALQSTGKIKTLTLIDPGPEYTVAPLVSFFGCSGIEATALYILGTGWPLLTDFITDPVEKIIVKVVKKIVPAGTEITLPGFIDIFALDKYRSIQITSSVLDPLPPTEAFFQTHTMSLPPLLLSVGAAYSYDTSKAIRINEGFGSANVKSTVRGKIVVAVQDGYRGPAKASVIRSFMMGPPQSLPHEPLVITPSSGVAYITTRHRGASNSGGTTGGFSYVEISQDASEAQDTLDISGVLTGGFGINSTSDELIVTAEDIASQAVTLARARGINDINNLAIAVAHARVTAQASLFLRLPVSCPRILVPGTTFLYSAGVEKWRFGVYVQTLIYLTVPLPCEQGGGGY